MKRDLAEELLESPKARLIIERVSETLEAEERLRRHFYETVREDQKAECINGEIIIHSPVKKIHETASSNLFALLKPYVLKHRLGYVGHEKMMIRLTRNDYEPDVCFFSNEKAASLHDDQTLFPPPDFVVEVLSSGTYERDRGIKYEDYEAHGVKEYWIVDPQKQVVEQYLLEGPVYELKGAFNRHKDIESHVVAGFRIPVKAIFEQDVFLKTLVDLIA